MTKTRQKKITSCVIHLYAVQAKLTDGDESQWLPPGAEKMRTDWDWSIMEPSGISLCSIS